MTVAVVPSAAAFELHAPPASCEGHEFLTKQAAKYAGIDGNGGYLPSFEYGVRYVDLSGMKIATGWVSGKLTDGFNATQSLGGPFAAKSPISNPVDFIHENETTQHHHFCLRGGAGDLNALVMDTAGWIRKLFLNALKTPTASTQSIGNGGLAVTTQETVYTRPFLLGAAAHAVQDSFAHGKRTPVFGSVNIAYKVGHTGVGRPESLLKQFGGSDGKNGKDGFRDKGLYATIEGAVLYPKAAAGTSEHNYVYKDWQGQNFQSDKIWNGTVCAFTPTHLGSLQPHAFAAYLATKDLFEAFKRAEAGGDPEAELQTFFETWFRTSGGDFPGYGDALGKCSQPAADCQYFYIAGEQGVDSPPATVYWINAQNQLMWNRHLGGSDGASTWAESGGHKVGAEWSFKDVIVGSGGTFYSVDTGGVLRWYNHHGKASGAEAWRKGTGNVVGSGWGVFKRVFAGGPGVLYGIKGDGTLQWYLHKGHQAGTAVWEGPKTVGTAWSEFTSVFAGPNGVIYAVKPDGALVWYRHKGHQAGTAVWEGPKTVGTGWSDFKAISAGPNRVIYARKGDGSLVWYRHDGQHDGTAFWKGPKAVGSIDGTWFGVMRR